MKKTNKQTKQNKEHHWKNFLNNSSLICCFLTTTETNLRTFSLVQFTLRWKLLLAATVATTKGGHKGGV